MNLKLKKEMNHLLLLDVLIDDDDGLIIELGTFSKNIKKEVIRVIDSFFFFLMRYDERNSYNVSLYGRS
jgi:hypothetical protein